MFGAAVVKASAASGGVIKRRQCSVGRGVRRQREAAEPSCAHLR